MIGGGGEGRVGLREKERKKERALGNLLVSFFPFFFFFSLSLSLDILIGSLILKVPYGLLILKRKTSAQLNRNYMLKHTTIVLVIKKSFFCSNFNACFFYSLFLSVAAY